MRLVLTLLVRDEADVVAATIEHHLAAGVDFIVATDNGSADGTADILAAYRDAGVLELHHESEQTYEQARWVTFMAQRAASTHGADWVINADADEFWWPRDVGSLSVALGTLPPQYGSVEAPRENLVAAPGRIGPWPDRLVLRDLLSLHERGGRIGSKLCHRADPQIAIAQGNHRVRSASLGPAWPGSPITVLHVPDRGYAQFENKIRVGGSSLAANPRLDPAFGWHWRADYERLRDGTLEQAWRARQLTEEQAEAGLAEGRLVRDGRLADRLRGLLAGAVRPDLLQAVLTGGGSRGGPLLARLAGSARTRRLVRSGATLRALRANRR